MPIKDLNFISGNPNKLSELRDILGDTIQVKNTPLDLIEIQGSSQDIALDKCRRACHIVRIRYMTFFKYHWAKISKLLNMKVQGPVLVEDTALCFDAFNGLPGPYM